MRVFASRGYVAAPNADQGVIVVPGKLSLAVVMYSKPGYVPDANHYGAPLIMVVSSLNSAGTVDTDIAGGFVVIDATTGGVSLLDPAASGSSALPGGHGVVVPSDWRFCCDKDQQQAIGQYVMCAGLGNSTCVLGGIGMALAALPLAVASTITCVAANTDSCLHAAMQQLPH